MVLEVLVLVLNCVLFSKNPVIRMPNRFREQDVADLEALVAVDSDDEFLDLLLDMYVDRAEERREERQGRHGLAFDLDGLSDTACVEKFRFPKADIPTLCHHLGLPDLMTSPCRLSWSGVEGLCVVLARLSTPNRSFDLEEVFHRGTAALSEVFNVTLDFLYNRWCHLFDDISQHTGHWLTPARLQESAQAVAAKCPLNNVFGFVDGTCRRICRPKHNQRIWYSGHKRRHVMKFQSVMLPCGIIGHLFGPFEGRRHDATMLYMSDILQQMRQHLPYHGVIPDYVLFGDKGYPIEAEVISPFRGNLSQVERDFNQRMSLARICVEWGFAGVCSQWQLPNSWLRLRINLVPIGQYYVVAALLFNCMACLYGNQTSQYFNVQPPTLAEYLH